MPFLLLLQLGQLPIGILNVLLDPPPVPNFLSDLLDELIEFLDLPLLLLTLLLDLLLLALLLLGLPNQTLIFIPHLLHSPHRRLLQILQLLFLLGFLLSQNLPQTSHLLLQLPCFGDGLGQLLL